MLLTSHYTSRASSQAGGLRPSMKTLNRMIPVSWRRLDTFIYLNVIEITSDQTPLLPDVSYDWIGMTSPDPPMYVKRIGRWFSTNQHIKANRNAHFAPQVSKQVNQNNIYNWWKTKMMFSPGTMTIKVMGVNRPQREFNTENVWRLIHRQWMLRGRRMKGVCRLRKGNDFLISE